MSELAPWTLKTGGIAFPLFNMVRGQEAMELGQCRQLSCQWLSGPSLWERVGARAWQALWPSEVPSVASGSRSSLLPCFISLETRRLAVPDVSAAGAKAHQSPPKPGRPVLRP